jgi:signal transduction histidine kinase
MSPANHNTNTPNIEASGSDATPDPADQLAHELANLLDGSLRHLGIVIDTLRGAVSRELGHADETADPDALLSRLQTTDRAMRQMVTLIHAWMKKESDPVEMFSQPQTLRQMLDEVIHLHRPAATRHGIELCLTLGDSVADMHAGPIFPIVANGLRNSIEAISDTHAQVTPGPYRIDIEVVISGDQLHLTVRDDGPGLDPSLIDAKGTARFGVSTKHDGHGLGLSLSQQIARSLNGSLQLSARQPRGAELILRCPLSSLTPALPENQPT